MRHFINGSIQRIECACSKCRSARDHDNEEKVDKLQNKEKTIDEVAANEEKIKEKEKELAAKIKKSQMSKSAEELDEELNELREELESLKKGSKKASTNETIGINNDDIRITKRHVLKLNDNIESREGDELLKLMGSQ